nr:signal peptide peptidase SppA [Texcoconibacillus texcoconensis]
MNGKRWIALVIAAGLLFLSAIVSAISAVATTNFENLFEAADQPFEERVIEEGNHQGKIAVIHLNGVIQSTYDGQSFLQSAGYNHQRFMEKLDSAAEDANVDGIILQVNTPGGGVVESDEIHDKVVEIQESYNKPVYVSMGNMAASGGYYIAAPAEKIYAHNQTITGSLGVIMQSINIAELFDQFGIESEVIKSGEHKDIMSQTREMTEDERDLLQEMVDESYEQFVDVIEEGRDMEREEVLALADGRIYSGQQALREGLVDELGHFDDVVEDMRDNIGKGDIQVVEYGDSLGIPGLFASGLQEIFGTHSQTAVVNEWLHQADTPRLMYLYKE